MSLSVTIANLSITAFLTRVDSIAVCLSVCLSRKREEGNVKVAWRRKEMKMTLLSSPGLLPSFLPSFRAKNLLVLTLRWTNFLFSFQGLSEREEGGRALARLGLATSFAHRLSSPS